jgi:TP53 regulating kinase-like protein
MEYIDGQSLKSFINSLADYSQVVPELSNALIKLGEEIAKLHDCNIVHGDLTTSNVLLTSSDKEPILIDFGLGTFAIFTCFPVVTLTFILVLTGLMKPNPEDKAVDLYVLERAFVSTHPNSEFMVEMILKTYQEKSIHSKNVLSKLEQVRQRGRKREMLG